MDFTWASVCINTLFKINCQQKNKFSESFEVGICVIQSTPGNSNPLQLEVIFISLQVIFHLILPLITQTPDNSNFFYFPKRFELSGVDCIKRAQYQNLSKFKQ